MRIFCKKLNTRNSKGELYFQNESEYGSYIEKAEDLITTLVSNTSLLAVERAENELEKDYSNLDSFVIYMCVSGSLEISHADDTYTLNTGETILLPATVNAVKITASQADLLEIYL